MRMFAYTRLLSDFGELKGGQRTLKQRMSRLRLLCQDLIQTCLSLAAVGAFERIGHATFGGAKSSVQKSELDVFFETQK